MTQALGRLISEKSALAVPSRRHEEFY
jgi:hypothetical protein